MQRRPVLVDPGILPGFDVVVSAGNAGVEEPYARDCGEVVRVI